MIERKKKYSVYLYGTSRHKDRKKVEREYRSSKRWLILTVKTFVHNNVLTKVLMVCLCVLHICVLYLLRVFVFLVVIILLKTLLFQMESSRLVRKHNAKYKVAHYPPWNLYSVPVSARLPLITRVLITANILKISAICNIINPTNYLLKQFVKPKISTFA